MPAKEEDPPAEEPPAEAAARPAKRKPRRGIPLRFEQASKGSAPPPEHYLTHTPAHPGCKVCMLTNMAAAPEPRGRLEVEERVIDEVKADNVLVHLDTVTASHPDIFGHRYAQSSYDQGSTYRRMETHGTRSAADTWVSAALVVFELLGPAQAPPERGERRADVPRGLQLRQWRRI